jgi:ketosteroid isomerase-like protein
LPTSSPGETLNLEIARRGWDALNRGDLDTVLSFVHPDVEWRPALGPGGMEGNVYRGKEAYERWLREELPEVWENFQGEALEFTELPDGRVLLLGYLHSRGRSSGAEVGVPFGQLARFQDGLVIRLDAYPDHASALEAAGPAE